MRIAALLLPLLLLAGCGEGGNESTPVQSATALPSIPPPAGKIWRDVVAKTEQGYVQGNPQASIKLVEYGSRSCPACGAFANSGVEELREKYVDTGRVSYEYREFWVHNQDPGLSLLGQCVAPEAFFPVLDAMYAEQATFNERATNELFEQIRTLPQAQQPGAWATQLGYVEFFKARGISDAKAQACLADAAALKKLEDTIKKVGDSGIVTGTPTFLINDKPVRASGWGDLEPALQAAGAR